MFREWGFLIGEIWMLLVLAALIGLLAGWFFWARRGGTQDTTQLNTTQLTELRASLDDNTRARKVAEEQILRLKSDLVEAKVAAVPEAQTLDLTANVAEDMGDSNVLTLPIPPTAPMSSVASVSAVTSAAAVAAAPVVKLVSDASVSHEPPSDQIDLTAKAQPVPPVALGLMSQVKASAPAAKAPKKPAAVKATKPAPKSAIKAEAAPGLTSVRPTTLKAARDGIADDLKLIKGIGPKMEALCHRLGFYHFDQIASWSPQELAWVDDNLEDFKGRATRDDWIGQARALGAQLAAGTLPVKGKKR